MPNQVAELSVLLTEAEVRALAKERQKKDNHNLSKSVASIQSDWLEVCANQSLMAD